MWKFLITYFCALKVFLVKPIIKLENCEGLIANGKLSCIKLSYKCLLLILFNITCHIVHKKTRQLLIYTYTYFWSFNCGPINFGIPRIKSFCNRVNEEYCLANKIANLSSYFEKKKLEIYVKKWIMYPDGCVWIWYSIKFPKAGGKYGFIFIHFRKILHSYMIYNNWVLKNGYVFISHGHWVRWMKFI